MIATSPSGRVRILAWLLPCLILVWAGRGQAATVNVHPTRIHLSPRATSAVFTLRNDGERTVRFQLSMSAWSQDGRGETTATETKDLLFHPPFLVLAPKESRKIRVGLASRMTVAGAEKTYRLLVEEMPPPRAELEPNAVTFLTNLSLPVFLTPPKAAPAPVLEAAIAKGTLSIGLRNDGSAYFQSSGLRVRGLDKDDKPIGEQSLEGWYVLAGKTRRFDVPIPRSDCLKMAAVVVEANAGDRTLSQRVEVTPRSCTP